MNATSTWDSSAINGSAAAPFPAVCAALLVMALPAPLTATMMNGSRVAYVSRRSVAHLVSWCRVDSWSLRSTEETWLSTVLTEMKSSRAISR